MQISCSRIKQVLGKTMLSFFSYLFLLVDGFGWPLDSSNLVFLLLYLLLPRVERSPDSIPLLFLLIGVLLVCYNCSSHAFWACDFIVFCFFISGQYLVDVRFCSRCFLGWPLDSITIFFLGGHLIQTCLCSFFQNIFLMVLQSSNRCFWICF